MILPKPNICGRKQRQNPSGGSVTTDYLKAKLAIKDSKYKDLLHLNQFLIKAESHSSTNILRQQKIFRTVQTSISTTLLWMKRKKKKKKKVLFMKC